VRPLIDEIDTIRNLNVKEVPADAPLRALEFMERHKLKPRDALHAAVMEHFGEREIVSDDADFDRVPSVKRVKV
jgi:predicted nucleic acid-binding protein